MTKSVIATQTQIDELTEKIDNLLSTPVVNLTEISQLEQQLRQLERQLEFLIESNDRCE